MNFYQKEPNQPYLIEWVRKQMSFLFSDSRFVDTKRDFSTTPLTLMNQNLAENFDFSQNLPESTDPTKGNNNAMNSKKKQAMYNQPVNDSPKQKVVSITYEEIGLFPRSFNRVFDRFFKQVFFDVENLVIQEYRFYRYLFLTTVKCLFILIFVPLTVNFIAKNYLVRPITEYYWNTYQTEIFLNSYQQKKAFSELKNFEEKIYFESLVVSDNVNSTKQLDSMSLSTDNKAIEMETRQTSSKKKNSVKEEDTGLVDTNRFYDILTDSVQKRLQAKTLEIATHYNEESVEAITNFFADVISFGTLCFLLYNLEIQINITKSFLLEVFFGLDDSKKSLLILFVTDLLVGYHSPNIWELIFGTFFDRYGLPESQTTIFLLVATLPVLLDVLFKYLIFRHLNRASPATVATYHAMIE